MKLLVTGGLGFLGGRFAKYIRELNYEFILGTRQSPEKITSATQYNIVNLDYNSAQKLKNICKGLDTVVHLAGMNAADCVRASKEAHMNDLKATGLLLESAIAQGVRRFIYVSSAHVYGPLMCGNITESTPAQNSHPYAKNHLAKEELIRNAQSCGDIEGIIIRLSNAFGAPAFNGVNCWSLLVNDLCRQATLTQRIVLHSSGLQRRNFIALTEACRAIRHLLDLSSNSLDDGVFNVGGTWNPTIFEMAQYVADKFSEMTGMSSQLVRGPAQDNEESVDLLNYNIDKFAATGFQLSRHIVFEKEVENLLKFCLANEAEFK